MYASMAYLVLPAGVFLLNYQNGLKHIAISLLPFCLSVFYKFLHQRRIRYLILFFLLIAFALLISVSLLLPLIIGCISVILSMTNKKHWQEIVTKTILAFLLAIALSSFWYTPSFWFLLLSNPSFGGVPLITLIITIFQLMINIIPLFLAIAILKWRHYRVQHEYLLFVLLLLVSYALLTCIRFLSNPAFVTDWTGFFLELQFAIALLLGVLADKYIRIKNILKYTIILFIIFTDVFPRV